MPPSKSPRTRRRSIHSVATAKGFGQRWAADINPRTTAIWVSSTEYRLKLEVDQPPAHAESPCESGDERNGTRIAIRLEARGVNIVVRFARGGWRSETDYSPSCNTTPETKTMANSCSA
jgi:hypothetical protein